MENDGAARSRKRGGDAALRGCSLQPVAVYCRHAYCCSSSLVSRDSLLMELTFLLNRKPLSEFVSQFSH